ncbi:hypothetical protein [Armatimonas sp.]|uniref:hypothetical protein n=1 Tax=Armatimonas sp. TaxID=1872638 RepID=UPI00286B437C|nr:hypothetical protein [Armatimonas sp.]
MQSASKLEYAKISDLYLDPKNPRLGREVTLQNLSQDQILETMQGWALEELAISFIESGFWIQESLMVIRESYQGVEQLVVVEGNRRLAALKLLHRAKSGHPVSRKWATIAASASQEAMDRLAVAPYLLADSRSEIQAYLGFRHVSGIKEWAPAEKAEFIAKLIDEEGLTYTQVMRKIGSHTETVRRNYISYRILLQMESTDEQISISSVENKFSVLFLSLRTSGVQSYLSIDIEAEPDKARVPVPKDKIEHLIRFAEWLFGTEKKPPLISDSRYVDQFGRALESIDAVAYLETSERPILETAFRIAGGDQEETISLVEGAAYSIRQALGTVHHYTDDTRLQKAIQRLGKDVLQVLKSFPEIRSELLGNEK